MSTVLNGQNKNTNEKVDSIHLLKGEKNTNWTHVLEEDRFSPEERPLLEISSSKNSILVHLNNTKGYMAPLSGFDKSENDKWNYLKECDINE